MRYLVLPLLLCLPLRAGDPAGLKGAVAKFGSDYPDVREAGTQEARQHIEAALSPLLDALTSKDPEVSRRARRLIESLLPGAERKSAEPGAQQGGQVIVFNNGNRRNRMVIQQVWVNGRMQMRVVNQQKEWAQLKKFGVEGMSAADPTLRMQLGLAAGRGYTVQKVFPGTAAEKLGLKPHDILVRVDDTSVMELKKLIEALGDEAAWPGRKLRVFRRGKVVDLPQER